MYQVHFPEVYWIWAADIYSSHVGSLAKNKAVFGPGQTVFRKQIQPQGNVPSLLPNICNSSSQSEHPELDVECVVSVDCACETHIYL